MSSTRNFESDSQSVDSGLEVQDSPFNRSFDTRTRGNTPANPVSHWSSNHTENYQEGDPNYFRRDLGVSEREERYNLNPSQFVERGHEQTKRTSTVFHYGSHNDLRDPFYQQKCDYGLEIMARGKFDTRGQVMPGQLPGHLETAGQVMLDQFPSYRDTPHSFRARTSRPAMEAQPQYLGPLAGNTYSGPSTAPAFQSFDKGFLADHTTRFPTPHMATNAHINRFVSRDELQLRQSLHLHSTDQFSNIPWDRHTEEDGFAYLRSVVIRTLRPIREPYDIDSYFKRLFRNHHIIDYMLMDSFEGVVYVTFKDEQDAHKAIQMTHIPEASNILEIWIPRREEFDFLKDSISVHGGVVSHPDFKHRLIHMVTTETGHTVIQAMQSDCPASMLVRVNKMLSLIEISRVLIAVSMDLDVKVAPVKKCFMISLHWDQRCMTDSVVLDYIQWTYRGVQIKSIHPIHSGLLVALENESDISKIISEKNHEILGRPLEIHFYHPSLSLRAYQNNSDNNGASLVRAKPLKNETFDPYVNLIEGAKHSTHQDHITELPHESRNPMNRSEGHISEFNQFSTIPQNTGTGSAMFTRHRIPNDSNNRSFDHGSLHFTAETREEFHSITPLDQSQNKLKEPTSLSSNAPVSNKRHHPSAYSSHSENSIKSESNTDKMTMEFQIGVNQLQLLLKTKCIEKQQEDHSSLKIDYESDSGKMIIFGDAHMSKLVKFEIIDYLDNEVIAYDLTHFREEELQISRMIGLADQINEDFKKDNIVAFMSCENDNPTVLYEKNEDEKKIESTLHRFIAFEEVKIETNKIILYQSKQWGKFLEKIKSEDSALKFSIIKLDESAPCILLVGSSHMQFKMKKKLKEFEKNNSYKEMQLMFDDNLQEYLDTFLNTELQQIIKETKELGATIERADGAFLLVGLEDGLMHAEDKLTNLRNSIKTKRQSLDYPGCTEFLQRDGEEDFLKKIGRKYSCLIKLSEDDAFDESTDEEEEVPLTIISSDHIKHCKITVVKGDPQILKVNSIINFIKLSSLEDVNMPKGFVGGQHTWQKVKKDLIAVDMANLETSGEKDRNLKIQHFVFGNEKKSLSEALKLGFNRASTSKCQSLAIALDGLDNSKVSEDQCSRLVAEAVTKHLKNYTIISLKDIFICGSDEKLLNVIASQLGLKSPQENALAKHQVKPKKNLQSIRSHLKHGTPFNSFSSSRSSVTIYTKSKIVFKQITVQLVPGDILSETTDAIVTSVNGNLDMSQGLVIRYVLQKGGNEIQEELNVKYPNGISEGEFSVTGAGQLPFKQIYHACLPTWNASPSTRMDPIKQLIFNMLEEACKENLSSIAIPALGTTLSYDPAMTCRNILSAIEDFASKNQKSTVNSVKLVIFTKNTDIMKVYGQAFFIYGSKLTPKPQTYSTVVTPASKPSNSFGNIAVQLTSGDITNQKTNAIVVSVDKTLDLRKGKVASAILTKGGQQIQTELHKKYPNGLEHFEYVKTSSGNLACKEIFFVCLPHWQSFDKIKMRKLLLTILQEIDSSQGTTVSLPAFGTGNLGYPPEKTQNLTIRALQSFATSNPKHLRTVEIVVHPTDTAVQQAFLKGLNMPQAPALAQASLQMISIKKKEPSGVLKKIGSAFTNALGLSDSSKSTENIFKVGTVTLTVKRGDITEEECDAFVVAVRDDMNLESSGAVGSQIAKKCDKDFIKKFQQKANDFNVYGITSVDVQEGTLKFKEVYFISMEQYSNQWDIGIEKILQAAEKKGWTTLALPIFGAALPDTDVSKLIQQIKLAIVNFGKESPKSLTDIRLVVYDKDMLKAASEQSQGSLYSESVILTGEDELLSENANVIIYFTEETQVKSAMEEFITMCSFNYKDHSYKNTTVKQFTDAHFKTLVKEGHENMFKVTYNKDDGMININGFGDLSKIMDVIAGIEKEIQEQMFANLSTDAPVHWQYEIDDIFIDFSNVLNIQLEADFKGKKKNSVIDFDDKTYSVDFEQSIITHKDGSTIKIQRRDDLAAGEPIPNHWDAMSVDEPFKLVKLAEDSEEFEKVVEYSDKHGAIGDIHKIERVQNRSLYQQYIAKKREIELRNPGHQNEHLLFHGSDYKAVNSINRTGFNRSYCGKNATVFGFGVYFAQSAAYSEQYATPDANDRRKMYQARVLGGVSVITDSSTKYLPKQPGKDIPYDSGRAPDTRKEGIHIIFHDSQAYPEYIITFSLPDDHVAP